MGGCNSNIGMGIISEDHKDIIIEQHDPFSKEGLIKSMSERDDFLNTVEYIGAKRRFEKSGFTEYVCNKYHLFYKSNDSSLESWMSKGPFILVERDFGFYEELAVYENICTPNYNNKNSNKEYIVHEEDKQKLLTIDLWTDTIIIE